MKNSTDLKVPKKYHKMIDEIYFDDECYWVHISDGYWSSNMESQTISEETKSETLKMIREIEKQ